MPVLSKKPKRNSYEDDNTLLDSDDMAVEARSEGGDIPSMLLAPIEEEMDESSSTANEESNAGEAGPELGSRLLHAHMAMSQNDPLAFIACVPPRDFFASQLEQIVRQGTLGMRAAHDKRPCLVLDLDETLIHSSVVPLEDADFVFPVEMQEGMAAFTVYAKKRPHCDHFLRVASQKFELVIFTASKRVYADRVLDLLDPEGGMLQQRLFREHCVFFAGSFLKDLGVLNRDLSRTVIVDNSPQTFALHVHNGIPIDSYLAMPEQHCDTQLLELLGLLDHVSGLGDVRPFLEERFQLHARAVERRALQ